MPLITTMGQPSSPLFLTGETAIGVDLTGLDYYFKKKEAADENLRKRLADQAPEIKEFDQKIKALPGEKTYLYQQYAQKRNTISEGVKKYGGVWAVYANTAEGREALGAMGADPYNFTMAEKNQERWDEVTGTMNSQGLGKNIYLDQNYRPIAIKDKAGRTRYSRNEDFMQKQAQDVQFDNNGNLAAKDYSITTGDSQDVVNEIAAFASKVGSTSSSSGQPVLGTYQTTDENGNVVYKQGSSVMGGNDAYNYIVNTKVGSKSNTKQLGEAVGVIANSLSTEAQQGIWQEIYSGAEGKRAVTYYNPATNTEEYVDYKKLDTDENYRNEVYQGYVYKRVKQGVEPFKETAYSSETSIQNLGQATGAGEVDKKAKNEGYYSLAMQGKIQPDETRAGITYVKDETTGKYVAKPYESAVFKNNYANEKLAGVNKRLAENPTTLGAIGANNIIYNGNNNNLGENAALRGAQVMSYNSLETGPPLMKDAATGQTRTMTAAETTRYETLSNKDESAWTASDQQFMDNSVPGMYWSATIKVDESIIDSNQGPKMINEDGEEQDVVQEGFWFGINDITDTEEGNVQVDDDGNYTMQVLIPASRGDALIGASQTQEDQTLIRFMDEEQLIIDEIMLNQQKVQEENQIFNNSLY